VRKKAFADQSSRATRFDSFALILFGEDTAAGVALISKTYGKFRTSSLMLNLEPGNAR
jgi:hypothetical protein